MNSSSEINVSVTFRNTEPTEALKQYATDKLKHCIHKYVSQEAEVHVILLVEKRDHTAEVRVLSKNYDADAKATTSDLYSAIDKVVDTIHTLLRKQKERLKSAKHNLPAKELGA